MPGLSTCPMLENISRRFEKRISSAVKSSYFAVDSRVNSTIRKLLPFTKKDVLPSHQCSNLVYLFVCHCDCGYVVARPNVFKNLSNSTSLNSLSHPAGKTFLADVKPTVQLGNFTSLPLTNTFLMTLYVLLTTMTSFQFLPNVVPSFIFPP